MAVELERVNGRPAVPGTPIALLTNTSKMPSMSWSLPAHQACPAKVVAVGSICGSCYAAKGAYKWNSTMKAQRARFEWVVACMRSEAGMEEFVNVMVAAIGTRRAKYFRVHDSGDLFNPNYCRAWARIARALPGIKFWIPTRVWRFLDRPAWRDVILELAGLDNVTMRPSALYFDDVAPIIDGMAAGTTATASAGYTCPAPKQGNSCGDCRVCWDRPDVAVSYHRH